MTAFVVNSFSTLEIRACLLYEPFGSTLGIQSLPSSHPLTPVFFRNY